MSSSAHMASLLKSKTLFKFLSFFFYFWVKVTNGPYVFKLFNSIPVV